MFFSCKNDDWKYCLTLPKWKCVSYYLLKQLNLHQRCKKRRRKRTFHDLDCFILTSLAHFMIQEWLGQVQGCTHQMSSGTHWSPLPGSCNRDNTVLPYQEWSKRALLGFFKLLLSKQTDISETGMWKHTDSSTKSVLLVLTKSDWILSHCCHPKEWVKTDWPVHESLIDMDC